MKHANLALIVLLSLFLASGLQAQSKVWNGSVDTDWTTPDNWTPSGAPSTADSVIINPSSNDPTLSSTTPDLMHVRVETGATLTLSGGSKLNIDGSPSDPNGLLFGLLVRGSLNVANTTDTIYVRNTTSDGLFLISGSSFQNNGIIITDNNTFVGVHFGSGPGSGPFVNNGEIWINNITSLGVSVDGPATVSNNGKITISNAVAGIGFRSFSAGTNQLINQGEIIIGTGISNATLGSNLGGNFINEQCAILTVQSGFGGGVDSIRNNGLINYNAASNGHTGTYTDNGFQFDPNGQLSDDASIILSAPLNKIQFNYNLDGDATTLCQGDHPDDLPPNNDDCIGAIDYETTFGPVTASCEDTVTLDFSKYGDAGFGPTCDIGNDAVAWYTWTATDTSIFFFSITGDPGIELLQGSCDSLTSVVCLNNVSGIISGLTVGTTYYMMIWDDDIPGASNVQWGISTLDLDLNPMCGDTLDYPRCNTDYGINDLQTFTICPQGNDTASITFTYFDIETSPDGNGITGAGCFDFIEVFDDGVSMGTYCSEASGDGNAPSDSTSDLSIHNTFTASDTGHCLTVVFDSDGSINETGFTFIVNNCTPPCDLLVTNTLDAGPGSLRDAIACAASGDTIRFDAGIDGDSIKLTSGQITIDKDLTILGNGRANTIIDGSLDDASRLFECSTGHSIEFRHMTMQHGGGTAFNLNGGAFLNFAKLKLVDCHFHNNRAKRGGVFESVTASNRLAIINCELSDNVATEQSGAINMFDGEGIMVNSLIHDNTAGNIVGGVLIFGSAHFEFIGTTITDNSALLDGGVRIEGAGTTADFFNTIISGNVGSIPDLLLNADGTINNFRNNILGSTVGNSLTSGFILGYPSFVDTANNNYQLLAHSIGIDGGDNAFLPVDSCDVDENGNTAELLPIDLAGSARSLRCNVDIGAFEFGTATFCPAVNDLCTGALPIGCDSMVTGDLSMTTTEGRPGSSQCLSSLNGLWYKYVGTGDSVSIEVIGTIPGIQIFTGDCDGLMCVAQTLNAQLGFVGTVGEEYLIYIDGFGASFTASLTCFCQPVLNVNGTPNAGTYRAASTLNSDAIIESANALIFRAGNEILLSNDFEVELGAEFDAEIGPCP